VKTTNTKYSIKNLMVETITWMTKKKAKKTKPIGTKEG
jgi:hypothetical protein